MSEHRVPLDLCMDQYRYTDKESAMFTAGYEFAVLIQELSAFIDSGLHRMGSRVSHENGQRAATAAASMRLETKIEDLGQHFWLTVTRPTPLKIANTL